MSLEAYQLFCTAAEVGNLTRAAELLNITPSAASHSIRALERSLGVTLLTRSHNGISLTAYGESLLPFFRQVLTEEDRLQEEVAQINHLIKGTVRVGVFESVCNKWFPDILRAFSEKYPNIVIRIYQDGYQAIEKMLVDSVIDIGFVSLPTKDIYSTTMIYRDPLLCIAPPDFHPKNGVSVTADDLRDECLMISRRGFDRTTEAFIADNHLEPSIQHNLSLDSSAIALVECGFGVSILPELVLKNTRGNFNTFPLAPQQFRNIAIATLKRRSRSPAAARLIEEIQQYVKRTASPDSAS